MLRGTFRSGLTRRAPERHAGELALGADSNPGPAARALTSGAPVHRGPAVAGKAPVMTARQVGAHGVSSVHEELRQLLVGELARRLPRIHALVPHRLAPVDVADAGGHLLVREQLADGGRAARAGALEHAAHVPFIGQDVRAEVADLRLLVPDQLDDGRGEADRGRVRRLQQRLRLPLGTPPPLALSVHVPGASHAHMGVDGEPVVEADEEVLADRLDLGDGAAGESLQRVGSCDHDLLAFKGGAQRRRGSPDGVAFGHLRQSWRKLAAPGSQGKRVRQAPDQPAIVGRQAELRQLAAGLDRAFAGRGGTFFLKGEPGIGKTCLAEQCAADAEARGAAVHWGRSTREEGAPPYWPWRQVLRSLAQSIGRDEVASLAGSALADIVQVAPELRELLGDVAASAGDEAGRFRAYDGVAQLLVQASNQVPAVIVLEDLHWADAPSLILLQHLAGAVAPSRLVVIGTYRDRELSSDHLLRTRLAEFVRAGEVVELPLTGLGSAEVGSLLRMMTSYEPSPDVVQRLQAQTAGNPFFVKEVARSLGGDDGLHPRSSAQSPAPVPEGVAAVLRRRVSGLSPSTHEAVAIAAVAGHQLDLALMTAATGLPRTALLAAFDEAADAGVLIRDANGYQFAHGLYRDTVYAQLATARRAGLHATVAN